MMMIIQNEIVNNQQNVIAKQNNFCHRVYEPKKNGE